MFRMLCKTINFSSEEGGQLMVVVSISVTQLQIGYNESWKLCLNLWSQRWLNPNLNLVSSFILLQLWQLKMLFGDYCMNFNIVFLKIDKLLQFFILLSRLFHSVTVNGKYAFLKKICLTLNWKMLLMFLVLYVLPMAGYYWTDPWKTSF